MPGTWSLENVTFDGRELFVEFEDPRGRPVERRKTGPNPKLLIDEILREIVAAHSDWLATQDALPNTKIFKAAELSFELLDNRTLEEHLSLRQSEPINVRVTYRPIPDAIIERSRRNNDALRAYVEAALTCLNDLHAL